MNVTAAAGNVWGAWRGGVADLRRMPRDVAVERAGTVLFRYRPTPGVVPDGDAPVLLIPPLGAPDLAYDLRRGCSLVEHLLGAGRTVYLVDYGSVTFAQRRRGLEHWVDGVVPWAIRGAARCGGDPHLLGWSLGGIFGLLAVAAAREAAQLLPVATLTVIASPVDVSAVPLLAALRPLVVGAGGAPIAALYRMLGGFPAPLVRAVFRLTAFDRLGTGPVLARLDDRDHLAQIEAVGHLIRHVHGYPGRAFGQLYHLMLRNNDLAAGTLDLGGRTVPVDAVDIPVLAVAGHGDVLAPPRSVAKVTELLTGAPEVRFEAAPGGHVGVLTGRAARTTTWSHVDAFLADHR